MHMSNNEMINIIVFTFYDEVSVHCLFHCGVVPFDDQKKKKKKTLASSVRHFKVQHPQTIIPFSEFDPDRSE